MMEEALIARLRAAAAVIDAAGTYDGRATIDWAERRSNDDSAFPASVMAVVSPGREYDLDGPSGLNRPRVRFRNYGLTYRSAKLLARAIRDELERPAAVGGVRFHRGRLNLEIDYDPEDLPGGPKVFLTHLDFFLPWTG